MKITKLAKAKVIVNALHFVLWIDDYDQWPEPRRIEVSHFQRLPMAELDDFYTRAIAAIEFRMKAESSWSIT